MCNSDYEKLFAAVDARHDEYVRLWEDICNAESPTLDKAGVDRAGEVIAEKARTLGFEVKKFPQPVSGDVVMITMNPHADARPVSMSGHLDTVHPVGSFGTPAVHYDGDRLCGPGAIDCKGGIVASLYAMAALGDVGFSSRPVKLFLQSDEENSSVTSGKSTIKTICEQAADSIAFLNTESARDENAAVLSRKGILRYRFDVSGRANHASKCDDAVSAICEAAHKIIELEKLKDRKGGLTCNCGLISGGVAENSVPDKCTFYADMRFHNAAERKLARETAERVASTCYLEGSSCVLTLKSERMCMERTEKNVELLARANEIFAMTGLPYMGEGLSDGGSDAADVTSYGIPCIDNLGAFGGGLHTVGEFGYISKLPLAAKRLAAIAMYI